MAGRRGIEGLRSAVARIARAGHDLERFANELVGCLQSVVPHAAACVVTMDPATRLVTASYKFGGLAGHHEADVEWARLEYGTDDPTRLLVIAEAEVPARAVSHLPGGDDDSVRLRALLRPAGYRDELRMVARQGHEAWGGVNLFRAVDEPCFDRSEVLALASLSEVVAEGLRAGLVVRHPAAGGYAHPGPAVLIVDADGNVAQMSLGTTSLLDEIDLEANRSPIDHLVHGLAAAARGCADGTSVTLPRARLRAPSGRWLVGHAAQLAEHDGVTGDVVITIDEARPPEIMPLLASAFALSSREREVTQLVLSGGDTKSIAHELSMARYTVQDHLKSIFDKADVRSRRELVARVFFDQYAPQFGDDVAPTGWSTPTDAGDPHPGGERTVAPPVVASRERPGSAGGQRPHAQNGKQIGLVGRTGLLGGARSMVVSGVGVLFVGEPGVGKTRLLDETLAVLAAEGWSTERFVVSTAARGVPFGALLSLLPMGTSDLAGQVAGVREALSDRARGRPIALAVDDAHLLDEASLGCLVELVHHSDVTLLGTARSTEPMPSDLTALWSGEAIARFDVDPLDAADTTELARRVLGGEVGPELSMQLRERTGGVPLLVRELLLDATAQQQVVCMDGSWELCGDFRAGARVQELIASRLSDLAVRSRALIELLAVAEPIAVDLLTEDERVELDGLEQLRLARGEQIAGQWAARVDHPLIGDAVATALPTFRRVDLLREAAGRVATAGWPAPGDALRAASWLQECGDPVPGSLALRAGREALAAQALDRAGELARSALEASPREGHLLLGEVLRLQGRADEAEQALAVIAELADDDDTIVQVAMWRSTLRAHHAADPEGAVALLDAAADRVGAPERTLELRSEAALLAGILGRLDVAVDANRQILATRGLDGPTQWTAMMNLLFGQVMLAELTGIDELISSMGTMLDDVASTRPEGVDLYWALVAAAQALRGDLVRCEDELVPHVEARMITDQLHGVTAAILVQPLLYRGSAAATEIARAACRATSRSDPFLAAPIAHACHTLALAQAGDLEGARAALAGVDMSHAGDLRLDGFTGRASAAVAALGGDRDEAAEKAAEVGHRCIGGTYVQLGLLSMYDAVRYGRADLVAEDLRRHAEGTAAPLIDSMVAHAAALANRDLAGLAKAAELFATMGARTLVAEALDDLAELCTDEVSAARAATAAALWRRATPAVNALARPAVPPFADRELDVILGAVSGLTSKAIAEQLFVSARSVDGRLARAYRRLDLGGRAELATALAPLPRTA